MVAINTSAASLAYARPLSGGDDRAARAAIETQQAEDNIKAENTAEETSAVSEDSSPESGENSSVHTILLELTEEEEKQVRELKTRDEEVRAHENAHKSAGGGVVGNISYETVTGPDGREYAVGGEAQIDSSPVAGNPKATIAKMDQVIRAALAPAEPSSQDFAVARAAQAARLQAQRELRAFEQSEQDGNGQSTPLEDALEQLKDQDSESTSGSQSFEEGLKVIEAIENLINAARLSSA